MSEKQTEDAATSAPDSGSGGRTTPRIARTPSFRSLKTFENAGPSELLWSLMGSYLSTDSNDIAQYIVNHLEYTLARSSMNFDFFGAFQATSYSVRDRMIEFWNDTNEHFRDVDPKRVYYMSIEYLVGRSLQNAISALQLTDPYSTAVSALGYKLEALYEQEHDSGLGNGGLGRLASCFLDSIATLNYPGWGYGLRYNYGIFAQKIIDGYQVEVADYWLQFGCPWEIERLDVCYHVQFGGKVLQLANASGNLKCVWEPKETVLAVAYDTPIPGYGTYNTITMRLWSSRPSNLFDLASFNRGDYFDSIEAKQAAERITSVLYPNDSTDQGKELRLKQQYFFASATLQDCLRRFKKRPDPDLNAFCTKAAIQLNDTHPAVSIAELMRLLVDVEEMGWDEAWAVVTKTFSYTNHTVLPEALETWSVDMFGRLLPRHLQIIYEINHRFMQFLQHTLPDDADKNRKLSVLSIIDETHGKRVRMANLAVVGSHKVNGVAAIHTNIIQQVVFHDFYQLWPHKFNNKTNGVTPRRWLMQSNMPLAELITGSLQSNEWITNLEQLRSLARFSNDLSFIERLLFVKREAKQRLRRKIFEICGMEVDADSMFDVHVKRIHEYKRQLLNILGVIARYQHLKALPAAKRSAVVPKTVIFAGKAAPGYLMAKLIIKLINSVAEVVNMDFDTRDYLKVVFLPNYNVSLAQVIIPASDLSQHISTAGTEASGTSNMKFAMNGGLIVGTLDGANIEIRQHIGPENMFIFGTVAEEVDNVRAAGATVLDERLYRVLQAITDGNFGSAAVFEPLIAPLRSGNDYYLLGRDFTDYMRALSDADKMFVDRPRWAASTLGSIAGMGFFSSDRTIREYANEIWHVEPCAVPVAVDSKSVNTFVRQPSAPILSQVSDPSLG